MKIEVSQEKTIAEIQKEFSEVYPYLKFGLFYQTA